MQFTFELGEILAPAEEKRDIDDLMQRYSSAKRVAFNDLLRRRSVKDVTHRLETFGSLALNWRYCEHAARDADAELKSQRELLLVYLSDTYDRMEEVGSRLMKAKSPRKKERLQATLLRLEKRRRVLEKHIADGTIPKVVFGTRKLFNDRVKGKISNQEWKDARDNQLYSIGQANQKGNANVRIDWGGKRVGINFPEKIEPREAKGRVYRVKNTRRWFELRVNERFLKYMNSLRGSGRAYSVRVVRRSGRYFVQVSFEIALPSPDRTPERVCSIDNNPEGFAAAVVSRDGNLLAHRFFRDDRLVYASEGKRGSIIGRLVAEIVAWARERGAETFVIEDLKIKGSRSFGRRGNRVIYAFVRRKFAENLVTRCWKEGYHVDKVNPAYTSKVGDAKYKEMHGLSVHEAAAFCIGRKFFEHGERLEEPISVTVKDGKSRRKVPVRYVWASVHGYQHSADLRMEPPGRKGSAGEKRSGDNEAVFTGRPASERTPLSESNEEARKGRECGENPQATGNGVKPAPSRDGGKVTAAPLRDTQ
jgi:IS605 OrfB family transposase